MKFCLPLFLFLILIVSLNKMPQEKTYKKDDGKAIKINLEEHSYVIEKICWQHRVSDCLVHDPDCQCHLKKEENYGTD